MSLSRGLVLEVMSGKDSAPMETIERLEPRNGTLAASRRCCSDNNDGCMIAHELCVVAGDLGYGLVVPFPAYGFAALVSHTENLNSPKQ